MGETTTSPVFLAYLVVGAMTAAILLPFLRPVFRKWMGTARASRVRSAISAALLFVFVYIGGSLDKQLSAPFTPEAFFGGQTSLRTEESSVYPLWYADVGYPTADTDGDGIPDYWERRTHTNKLVADAAADPDHDGVDNAEEFLHQCDPLTKDTDGDGLTDREEIDGAALGLAGFNPLVRCEYPADTSDAEAWDSDTEIVVYSGVSSAGYPWGVDIPDEAADNVDVVVTVDSSRHAELSWNDGDDWPSRLLLPPCTNLALRLRVPAAESSSVALSPATGAMGLWKAALRAEWDERRGNEIERNRVRCADGCLMDITGAPAIAAGVLEGTFSTSRASPAQEGPRPRQIIHHNTPAPLSISMYARRAYAIDGMLGCRIHGPNPVFVASFTNAVPPFRWTVNGADFTTAEPELPCLLTADEYAVECFDSGGYTQLPLGTNAVFRAGQCQDGPATNIVGAGWTSTHNPTNATDHLPFVEEVESRQCGPLCPVYTNTVVHAGWTHDTAILWIRNLVRKLTGKPEDDDTDHCINVLWNQGGSVDLWSFLDPSCLPYTNALSIRVWKNGASSGQALNSIRMGDKPSEMLPTVHNVVLCDEEGTVVYDRLWLVICSPDDEDEFATWYAEYSGDLEWLNYIPTPPSFLVISTNTSGCVSATLPASFTDHSSWSPPLVLASNSHLHHNAVYELRTETIDLHGNQATYDANGHLITSTIAAGTADYYQPFGFFGNLRPNGNHRRFDVLPYIRALQLDGNPGMPNSLAIPTKITHPCIRQGTFLEQYLFCRPCIY